MDITTQYSSTPATPMLGIALPPQWRRRSDPERGIVVSARVTTLPASGVRPEITLRCAPVDGTDLDAWRAEVLAEAARSLDDFALEDADTVDLDGHDVAYRRFAHRIGPADVLCEQWSWLLDGYGVTLTGSVAREDYADHCDLFETVAETVEV